MEMKRTEDCRHSAHATGDCPSSARLAALAEGRLWPWQRWQILDHLSECRDCSRETAVLLEVQPGVTEALTPERGVTPWSWALLAPAAVAAAVLIIASLHTIREPHNAIEAQASTLFASDFGSTSGSANTTDRVFYSDFDRQPDAADDRLFTGDFDGQNS